MYFKVIFHTLYINDLSKIYLKEFIVRFNKNVIISYIIFFFCNIGKQPVRVASRGERRRSASAAHPVKRRDDRGDIGHAL